MNNRLRRTKSLKAAEEYVYPWDDYPEVDCLVWLALQNCGAHDHGSGYRLFWPSFSFIGSRYGVFGPQTSHVHGLDPGMWIRIGITPDRRYLHIRNILGDFVTQTAVHKLGCYTARNGTAGDFQRLIAHGLGKKITTEPVEVKLDSDAGRAGEKRCHVFAEGSFCWRLKVNTPVVIEDEDHGLTLPQAIPELQNVTFPLYQHPRERNVLLGPLDMAVRLGEANRGPLDLHRLSKLLILVPNNLLVDRAEDLQLPWKKCLRRNRCI